jgi:hypothetical protein
MFNYPYLYFNEYWDYYRFIYSITINTKNHNLALYKNNKIFKTYRVAVGKTTNLIATLKNETESCKFITTHNS